MVGHYLGIDSPDILEPVEGYHWNLIPTPQKQKLTRDTTLVHHQVWNRKVNRGGIWDLNMKEEEG